MDMTAQNKFSPVFSGPDGKMKGLIDKISLYAQGVLEEKRFRHSVRVAEYAASLSEVYSVDKEAAYLAGISHDICKNSKDRLLLSLAKRDGDPILDIEKKKPSLLHGRAGAVLLRDDFGVEDQEVLEAVKNHTFGIPGASDLTLLIYVSDKIEPGRGYNAGSLREIAGNVPLRVLALETAKECLRILELQEKSVSPGTLDMIKWLETHD